MIPSEDQRPVHGVPGVDYEVAEMAYSGLKTRPGPAINRRTSERSAGLALAWAMLLWPPDALRAQSQHPERNCKKDSYSNENYLFSVALPNGFSCCQNLPPSPVHGCRIALPGGKAGELWVDGSYNTLAYNSSDEASFAAAGEYFVTGTTIKVLRHEPTKLGGFEAVRLTLQIRKSGQAAVRIEDLVISIAPRGGGPDDVVYTVGFHGSEAEYAKHEKTFSRIVSSWRALKESAK
jgi:hypothetical protein